MTNDRYESFSMMVRGHAVACMTCLECGCALVLRSEVDVIEAHDAWHERLQSANTLVVFPDGVSS